MSHHWRISWNHSSIIPSRLVAIWMHACGSSHRHLNTCAFGSVHYTTAAAASATLLTSWSSAVRWSTFCLLLVSRIVQLRAINNLRVMMMLLNYNKLKFYLIEGPYDLLLTCSDRQDFASSDISTEWSHSWTFTVTGYTRIWKCLQQISAESNTTIFRNVELRPTPRGISHKDYT